MKENYSSELMSSEKLKYYIQNLFLILFNYIQQLLYQKEENRPSQGRLKPRQLNNRFIILLGKFSCYFSFQIKQEISNNTILILRNVVLCFSTHFVPLVFISTVCKL